MGPSLGEVPKYDMARVRIAGRRSAAPAPPQPCVSTHLVSTQATAVTEHSKTITRRKSPTRSAFHTKRCDAVPHGLRSQGLRRFTYD
jgi:hypothetical protein